MRVQLQVLEAKGWIEKHGRHWRLTNEGAEQLPSEEVAAACVDAETEHGR